MRKWVDGFNSTMAYCIVGIVSIGFLVVVANRIGSAWTKSSSSTEKQIQLYYSLSALVIMLVVIASMVAFGYSVMLKVVYPRLEPRGQFGDAFGAMNAVVSTVALLGLWVTVLLQYKQIKDAGIRADEDRRIIEQRTNKERFDARKQTWPAVVVSKLSGKVNIVGVGPDGMATFKFVFDVEQRNCSNQVLINVIRNLQTFKKSTNERRIDLYADVERFVLANGTISSTAQLFEKSLAGDDITDALSGCDGLVVCLNAYICTIQKDYYFISHQFAIRVANTPEDKRLLAAWIESLSAIKGLVSKKISHTDFNSVLINGLKTRGFSTESNIQIEFVPLPDLYCFRELKEREYIDALQGKGCAEMDGGEKNEI